MHQLILNLGFLQELCLRQDDGIIGYTLHHYYMSYDISYKAC